jgi:hypothetical protein
MSVLGRTFESRRQSAVQLDPLTVTVIGKGTVRVSGDRTVVCTASSCKRTFRVRAGSTVTLSAQAATGWKFARWAGACRVSVSSCKARVVRATSVGATFVPPGDRANAIPMGQAGTLGKGWRLTVNSVTPNANDQVVAYQDPGGFVNKPPPPGAQDFMSQVTLT